jgi:hypothetical protein
MDIPPFVAERWQFRIQYPLDPSYVPPGEPVVFAELRRTMRTAQIEHSFAAVSDDMDVRGTVIVWVNHDPQTVDPKNSRHILA